MAVLQTWADCVSFLGTITLWGDSHTNPVSVPLSLGDTEQRLRKGRTVIWVIYSTRSVLGKKCRCATTPSPLLPEEWCCRR